MELGAHVWLRSDASKWGWVPAVITKKESVVDNGINAIRLTLNDDPNLESTLPRSQSNDQLQTPSRGSRVHSSYFADQEQFEVVVTVDPDQLKTADHDDIKLRNLPTSFQLSGEDPEAGVIASPSTKVDDSVVGGVNDLIGLTHLHEPAILHSLRQRYDADIIYTSTGPILIAINPFKPMSLYSDETMERYRLQGEQFGGAISAAMTPFKRRQKHKAESRLPPHVYQTADDAYRAMMRGLENKALVKGRKSDFPNGDGKIDTPYDSPANQSILVSGESGAGKTVTTKIVLNYFAMLSKKRAEQVGSPTKTPVKSPRNGRSPSKKQGDVCIEQQVLQSNPILESFGNARTTRNDNSSRFGKYIDIRFTPTGKLTGASIETYLLEKVRLIRPSMGERNYHVFYQFLESATNSERNQFFIGRMQPQDFKLLGQTDTYGRRDGVSDAANHQEMLDAMITIGFAPETIQALMRLVVAVLFAGNITFTQGRDDSCYMDETDAACATAALLGVGFDELAAALTTRVILAGNEVVHKPLSIEQATKACEALIKAVYGAAFDYIVEKINESIIDERTAHGAASIGVLDIFGFETFASNNFEQLCINYTNEALQQQFNKYVFKLEQQEYEREGILWKFISFPDNQEVIDLIDMKHTGVLALLDEQCIVPKSTDEKFTRYLYSRCDKHPRFYASSHQRVVYKFSIEHYAGFVEYTTDTWLEKNKDQLPAASSELLASSEFDLIPEIRRFVRSEDREGRGTIATKSVGAQFSAQLRTLRARVDKTVPHYIRCLKPNDELVPNFFEPKNIVDQLRCGGVLEAVRVSRAGYPTRYPHHIFLARYYTLGDRSDKSPVSPVHKARMSITEKEAELKRLISKIAFDVWLADHQMMLSLLEIENKRWNSPKHNQEENGGERDKTKSYSSFLRGPQSLAATSSVKTPEEKRLRKVKNSILSTSVLRKRNDRSSLSRPETEEEFLSLNFSARCAVAGLQLGRTKVFLRREAFDRIEAMRSEKFYNSACLIQKIIRGRICRDNFIEMKYAAIVIQSLARKNISSKYTTNLRLWRAAIVIQSAWRMANTRCTVWNYYLTMKFAAIAIQCAYRRYAAQKRVGAMISPPSPTPSKAIAGITRAQAMYRGWKTRDALWEQLEQEAALAKASPPKQEIVPVESPPGTELVAHKSELVQYIENEQWALVENLLDKYPELAEEAEPHTGELPLHMIARHKSAWTLLIDMILVLYPKALIHRDRMGALPIHHAAAHDNLSALEIIYSAYKEGINDIDIKGRLPVHVASEFDAVDVVKFLLSKSPEGAFTMVHRPPNNSGGGLPLHIACRNFASIGVITALLAENFASAKRADENGDLPLHLLLRCGEHVDQVVVKTLLTCFAAAASRTDMNGDLPLAIALKNKCKPAVINIILMQYTDAAGILNGDGHSPLYLAFENNADDRTVLGLLNHAPELATVVDKKTGLLPIQVATGNEHSHFIVHNLLKRDMPIDLNEKVRAQLLPHHYSWNHIVTNTDDMYHQVVTKLLQQCTQPQVLALAHVEGPEGKIALASATPVCKHELRVMLRLFNTLEVVNQRPAYTNPISDTQIFYALRYEPPPQLGNAFTLLHEDKNEDALGDYVEDWDDSSQTSALSRNSIRSTMSSRSQQSIEEKLRQIRKEKGQQVIAKLTSRSDVVERELKVRKEHHLSRHYVPAIISVHHTVQHAAYSEAMAEPGYCITMEGADTTAENLMLDMRKAGKRFPTKALKRIGISLLHMHEHGIVHCDFGTHNIGKFGSRWKLLGVGGSVTIGKPTDPNRGFYHPPESILVESKRTSIGKKSFTANVVSIPSQTSYDIWAYGVVFYEAIAGLPLSPYACRGKRAMTSSEVAKIGKWDDHSLRKALKHLESDEKARDLVKKLLHHDPESRMKSMRDVLEHPFFTDGSHGVTAGTQRPSRRPSDTGSVKSSSSSPSIKRSSGSSVGRSSNLRSANRHSVQGNPSEGRTRSSLPTRKAEVGVQGQQENVVNGVSPVRRDASRYSATVARTVAENTDNNSDSPRKVSKGGFGGLRNTLRGRRSKALGSH